MNKATVLAGITLAAVSSAAFGGPNDAEKATGRASPSQQVLTNLERAGFTDVKVTSGSIVIQARDSTGNPVTMFVGPHWAAAEMGTTGSNQRTATTGSPNGVGGAFTAVPAKDGLSSKLVGVEVYNSANQNIGTIKDIAFNENGIHGYILSVGGFLGIGDRFVAVRPSSIDLKYDRAANRWRAKMDATADQLKAAPEFKYPSSS